MYPCQYKMLNEIEITDDIGGKSEYKTCAIRCSLRNHFQYYRTSWLCNKMNIGEMIMRLCQDCPYREDKNN